MNKTPRHIPSNNSNYSFFAGDFILADIKGHRHSSVFHFRKLLAWKFPAN